MDRLYYDCIDEHITGEEWKQHPIYTNYEGSSLGRIRNRNTRRIKKQWLHPSGRYKVSLSEKNKTINYSSSRFIIECFYGMNRDMECDHINSNPQDNKLKNLRWSNRKENINNPSSRKKYTPSKTTSKTSEIECYDLNGNLIKSFSSITEASIFLNLDKSVKTISSNILWVLNNKGKTAYGYKWNYKKTKLLEGEIFKKHPSLSIKVSNMGRIMFNSRKHTRVTYGHKTKDGYYVIEEPNVRKKFRVHRLVAETFIPNLDNKPQVDHINTIKTDNRVQNLRWCTSNENMSSNETRKKISTPIMVYKDNGDLVEEFISIRECCKEMKLSRTCVYLALKKGNGNYKNYKFILKK